MQLRVADAAGEELDDDLFGIRVGQLYFIDNHGLAEFGLDGGARLHGWTLLLMLGQSTAAGASLATGADSPIARHTLSQLIGLGLRRILRVTWLFLPTDKIGIAPAR